MLIYVQNKLEMLRIFCTAAESRNFKEAAKSLGISPQAVTRAIKELEQQRGEILFYRNTRQIKITTDGERLALSAREAIDRVERILNEKTSTPPDEMSGLIRITVAPSFGRRFIIPAVTAFSKLYPEIRIDCILTDTHSDVIDERIDIGIRFGFLPDSRYVAREVSKIHFFAVGTPELIEEVGAPVTIEELDHFPLTALIDYNSGRYWPWSFSHGRNYIPNKPRFSTDDLDTEFQAVCDGVGFGYMPGYLAIPHLRDGRLVQILENDLASNWHVYLYRPQRGPTALRIRRLFDYLVDALSDIET